MRQGPGGHLITFHGVEIRFGLYEPLTVRSEWDHLELAHAMQVFDPELPVLNAGAGMGFVAAMLSAVYGCRNVYSFEPNPQLYDLARRVHVDGQAIQVENAALWVKDTSLSFHAFDNWSSGTIDPERGDDAVASYAVQAFDINRILEHDPAWNVLLDVEGAEHDILPHMDMHQVGSLVVEMHPTTAQRWARSRQAIRNMFQVHVDAPDHTRTGIMVAHA